MSLSVKMSKDFFGSYAFVVGAVGLLTDFLKDGLLELVDTSRVNVTV